MNNEALATVRSKNNSHWVEVFEHEPRIGLVRIHVSQDPALWEGLETLLPGRSADQVPSDVHRAATTYIMESLLRRNIRYAGFSTRQEPPHKPEPGEPAAIGVTEFRIHMEPRLTPKEWAQKVAQETFDQIPKAIEAASRGVTLDESLVLKRMQERLRDDPDEELSKG